MGHPLDQFVDEVPATLLCCICHKVPQDVKTCTHCEDLFCYECLQPHLDAKQCPQCGKPISVENIRTPKVPRNILDRLKRRCQFQEEGCTLVVSLEEYQHHFSKCEYNPDKLAECQDCSLQIPQKGIPQHQCLRDLVTSLHHQVMENSVLKTEIASLKQATQKMDASLTEMKSKQEEQRNDFIALTDILERITNELAVSDSLKAKLRMEKLISKMKSNITFSINVENAFRNVNWSNFNSRTATESTVSWYIKCLNALEPTLKNGSRVLVMGAYYGYCGYLTCLLSQLVGESGRIVAQDHKSEYREKTKQNIEKDKPELVLRERIQFVEQDMEEPYHSGAPYDAIINQYTNYSGELRYLDLLNSGGIMLYHPPDHPERWAAFVKMEDGTANHLNVDLV